MKTEKHIYLKAVGFSEEEHRELKAWIELWQRLNAKQLHPIFHEAPDFSLIAEIQCRASARAWGMLDTYEKSQQWPYYEKARRSWVKALEQFYSNKLPALKGKSNARSPGQQLQERLFLAGIDFGKGQDPEFFQVHAATICNAALAGDVAFFEEFAQTRRRKIDPSKPLNYHVLACWMSCGLWNATNEACSELLLKHPEWGLMQTRAKSGEHVRQTWMDLKLWHNPNPPIKGWTFNDQKGNRIGPLPKFLPNKAPRV